MKPDLDFSLERATISETLLSSVARLIRSRSELEIIKGVCEALCEASEHIQLAWTWFGPTSPEVIRPQVYAGKARDYAATMVLDRNFLTEIGPAFRTLKGEAPTPFEVSPWSLYAPWRVAARDYGVRSVLAIPLYSGVADQSGLFVIYADHGQYFLKVGVGLFNALGAVFSSVLGASAEFAALKLAVNTDALTGVLNRHALPIVERRISRQSLNDPKAFVFVVDLDHFKLVNDKHGHPVGDAVLKRSAQVMRSILRRDDDLIRWGGEEFLVCVSNSSLEDALKVAEKLRYAIQLNQDPISITTSVGVAEVMPQRPLRDSIDIADQALFEAKRLGRNRVHYKC